MDRTVYRERKRLQTLALTALFAALVFVTTFFSVPAPLVGNINLGDSMVLLGAFVLGPWGAISAGLGAALCDISNGYAMYAPATLVIKALMALAAAGLVQVFSHTRLPRCVGLIIAGICAEAIMVFGYFAYEALPLQYGLAAAANMPLNAIQGVCGIVIAVPVEALISHLVGKRTKS